MGGTRISSQGYVPETTRLLLKAPSGGCTRTLVYEADTSVQDSDTSRFNTVKAATSAAENGIFVVAEEDVAAGEWGWFALSGELDITLANGVTAGAALYVFSSGTLSTDAADDVTTGDQVKIVGYAYAAPGASDDIEKCVFNGEYGFGTFQGVA